MEIVYPIGGQKIHGDSNVHACAWWDAPHAVPKWQGVLTQAVSLGQYKTVHLFAASLKILAILLTDDFEHSLRNHDA
jgi:hypothetical protein